MIASQWTVDSDATSILMKSFHKDRRSGGMKSADALRQANLVLPRQMAASIRHLIIGLHFQ
ncbi:MAG: CHAT domain-containing protein [Chloracidobacterium sp.]|nr:CHAT domain-containing protein [Chloracidobacterium sp.]